MVMPQQIAKKNHNGSRAETYICRIMIPNVREITSSPGFLEG
jgi:hypothetical protein